MNILVLCTGNSARSILLESLFNHMGQGRLTAFSAGSQPVGQINPHSISLLKNKGHVTDDLRSKSWDEFAAPTAPEMASTPEMARAPEMTNVPKMPNVPKINVVITVCGSAAGETCPHWPGTPVRAHWGVEDPAAVSGALAPAAFAEAFEVLERRAQAFLAEPVERMEADVLTAHLKACGALT